MVNRGGGCKSEFYKIQVQTFIVASGKPLAMMMPPSIYSCVRACYIRCPVALLELIIRIHMNTAQPVKKWHYMLYLVRFKICFSEKPLHILLSFNYCSPFIIWLLLNFAVKNHKYNEKFKIFVKK